MTHLVHLALSFFKIRVLQILQHIFLINPFGPFTWLAFFDIVSHLYMYVYAILEKNDKGWVFIVILACWIKCGLIDDYRFVFVGIGWWLKPGTAKVPFFRFRFRYVCDQDFVIIFCVCVCVYICCYGVGIMCIVVEWFFKFSLFCSWMIMNFWDTGLWVVRWLSKVGEMFIFRSVVLCDVEHIEAEELGVWSGSWFLLSLVERNLDDMIGIKNCERKWRGSGKSERKIREMHVS